MWRSRLIAVGRRNRCREAWERLVKAAGNIPALAFSFFPIATDWEVRFTLPPMTRLLTARLSYINLAPQKRRSNGMSFTMRTGPGSANGNFPIRYSAAPSKATGTIDVFARGGSGDFTILWQKSYGPSYVGGWSDWTSLKFP